MQSNVHDHVLFRNPTTSAEREEVAGACVRNLHIAMPALIDSISNQVEQQYTGWPDRLYLIDSSGRVRYKSEPGPFGFHPAQLSSALKAILG